MSGREFLNLEVDKIVEYLEGISSMYGLYCLGLSGIGRYNRLIKKLPRVQSMYLGFGRSRYTILDKNTTVEVVIKVFSRPYCDDVTVKVEEISKTAE